MREIYEPFDNAEEVWFWFCRSLDARMANMGISSSASADAANNRLIDEAFDEIENDNMAFLAEQDAKADGFNLKYRKNLLDTGLAAAGKVLK